MNTEVFTLKISNKVGTVKLETTCFLFFFLFFSNYNGQGQCDRFQLPAHGRVQLGARFHQKNRTVQCGLLFR